MSKDKNNRRVIYAIAITIISCLLLAAYWMANKNGVTSGDGVNSRYRGLFKDTVAPQATKSSAASTQRGITCLIDGIKVTPVRPTILDSLNVEVQKHVLKDGQLTFDYRWQINGKPVQEVKGNLFPAGLAKKNDRVTVTVTPYVDGVEYKEFNYSITQNIFNAAPSLILTSGERKTSDVITLQCVGSDPDSDKIIYALEEPYLDGMTIDKTTGKITWKPARKEPGVYHFRASATDSDGAKTAKTFEFSIEQPQSPHSPS